MFVVSLVVAAYLGFALIHLPYDKAVHFVVFGVLTAEAYHIVESAVWPALTLVGSITASVALEMVQHLVNPVRVFDPYDLVCNVCGTVVAWAACVWYHGHANWAQDAVQLANETCLWAKSVVRLRAAVVRLRAAVVPLWAAAVRQSDGAVRLSPV